MHNDHRIAHARTLAAITAQITAILHNASMDALDVATCSLRDDELHGPGCVCPDGQAGAPHYADCPARADPDPTAVDPEYGPEPTSYAIPDAPVTDRKVSNGRAEWQRLASGLWRHVHNHHEDDVFTTADMPWWLLLAEQGPVHLVPLTELDEADAVLYGPPGARWGDPDRPCPFGEAEFLPGVGSSTWIPCALGFHHAGGHVDLAGNDLGMTVADPGPPDPSVGRITTQEAAADPCTCGQPAEHLPECSRYGRTTGANIPEWYDGEEPF